MHPHVEPATEGGGHEKTAANFRSIVSFAAGLCLIKCVHTA
jgi:hypothetical protein